MRLLFFIFLVLPFTGFSQTPNWQSIQIEPSIKIEKIVSDTLGFFWIQSENILYRFDGKEAIAKLELAENITHLDVTISNKILIGTLSGKLLIFDPFTSLYTVIYRDKNQHHITGAYILNFDNFILLKYGQGIVICQDGIIEEFNTSNGLATNEVYDVEYLHKQFYVSTDQGIQLIDFSSDHLIKKNITKRNGLPDIVITNLLKDKNKIWFSDYNEHIGIISGPEQFQYYALPIESKINDLTLNEDELYIATNHGLFLFDTINSNLKFNKGCQITHSDDEGNLWLVTNEGEIIKGNLHFQKIDMEIENVRAIETLGSKVIIGGNDGLYEKTEENFVKIVDENVTCLKTINNYLFVGTFSEGVKIYDSRLKKIYQIKSWQKIPNQSVLNILPTNEGILISSLSGVMNFEFENGILKPSNSINPIIGQAYIYSMFESEQIVYFGTDNDGLYIWNKKTDEITKLSNSSNGAKIGSVYSITKDNSNRIWFTSTELGLCYVDEHNEIQQIKVPNIEDQYTSLRSINDNLFLLLRGNSIDIFDPFTEHFMYFDKEIGIENSETNLNNIALKDDENFFIHGQDFYSYKPAINPKIHPNVVIDEKRVNLSIIPFNKSSFKQNENNIEFDFIGSWLTDPQKLSYQYKLEGFDNEWRTTKDNSVSFPKLSPNSYNFKVRASENGLFNDEPEAQFMFTIDYHFYNLWWVKTLGLFVLIYMIFLVFKQRENRNIEKQALEKLIIENQLINLKNQLNPHFLFNTLNTLIGLIEEDKDSSVLFAEKIGDFYRNMLEFGKEDLISLKDEKEVLLQYIDILLARFAGQLVFDITWDISDSTYRIPPLTLQLLVENAVKHNQVSTKHPLTISIRQKSDSITVYNEKKPLSNKKDSTKTGLQNIKKRFTLVNLEEPEITNAQKYFQIVLKLKR